MLKIKFQLMSKSWTLRLFEKSKFKKKHGSGIAGITRWDKRQIDLHPGGFDLETIVHELSHAFFAEMCIASTTDMTIGDFEEVCCELIAKRGKELLSLADDLHSQVLNLTTPKLSVDK